ncbi:MAG: endonuclease I family protein [Lewinella sp.]|uniref:endonuclease I family protein n=1 Tax=Lewinella sp. TaxID=2004506 RepID=UPI003D6AB4A9
MKNLLSLFGLLLLLNTQVEAQDHEVIFSDLEGQDLLDAVIDNFTPGSVQSYGAARDILFGSIDKVNDSLYCVYTDWPVYITPGADPTVAAYQDGQGINTEHSWPQSYGAASEPAKSDMHHLFPTRVDVNQDRGNLPFGEVSDALTDSWYYLNQEVNNPPATNRDAYSEYRQNIAFEPRESFKGNIARALMYFYTIYRDEANANAPDFFNSQRATLCQWHEQDPVDAEEWARTFAIAQHQDGKPNPFVVDCTLPSRLYCEEIPDANCIVNTREVVIGDLSATFFPNPTHGNGQLRLQVAEAGLLQVRYYDPLGRIFQQQEMEVGSGEVSLPLSLPGNGFWFCELRQVTEQGLYQQRLPIVVLP